MQSGKAVGGVGREQLDIRDGIQKMNNINNIVTQELFSEHLVKFVVKQDQSFAMIETKEFRELIHLCNPKAMVFKADTLKRRIMSLYDVKKVEKINDLAKLDSKIHDGHLDITDASTFHGSHWSLHLFYMEYEI